MEEDNILKKKKKNYYQHHNQNKNYYYKNKKNQKKKNLIVENNNSEEVENILLYNNDKNTELIEEVPQRKIVQVIKENIPDYEEDDILPKKKGENNKSFFGKNIFKYGLGFAILVIAVFGVSYSFFSYRVEDSRQGDISSGEVYVKLVEQSVNLTLNKMYPRTSEEARSRDDNYIDFTIKAKNTSETNEVVYSINITNGENVVGKTRINPDYLLIDLQEVNGNNYTYIKEAEPLSSFSFTSKVPVNTTSEITKVYRLRVWVSDDIIISDTEPNATYTQTQFANLYGNLHIEVNSEDKSKVPTAIDTIAGNVDTNTTINFANISSSSNGEGLYILPGTENDTNPIYYYRGNINNNNVIFGGYCWQMVRTTDTGGIKMIYNGEPSITGSGANVTYNCGITRDIQDDIRTTAYLNTSTGYYYADDYEIVSTEGNGATYRLKSKTNPITKVVIANATAASTNIPTIAANYPYTCRQTTSNGTCAILYKVDSYLAGVVANVYASTDLSIIGTSKYDSQTGIVSDVGYMKNIRYSYTNSAGETGAIYGKNVEWNGTNYLVIENTANTASSNTTKDNNHHYSCGTAGTTSCPSVRYYYFSNYFITLTGGELVEDAIYKMTGNVVNQNIDVVTRNQGYVLNNTNSTIKTAIENWFRTNLTNEVDNTKRNYANYIEDTVYCNDRSFKTTAGSSYATYQESGWNPNGGDLTKYLYFGMWNRYENSWYSTTNVPSTACPNVTDRFSVSSSVAHLNYPVGLLTSDEIIMAGAAGSSPTNNKTYYLHTGKAYLAMSPYMSIDYTEVSAISGSGELIFANTDSVNDIRPVISLKLGTEFEAGGTGTPTNPYIVKYE